MSLQQIETTAVARIFTEDDNLIRNWRVFYDLLGLPSGDAVLLSMALLSSQMTTYELFKNILSKWVSQSGKSATIHALDIILREACFVDIAEILSNKYTQPSTRLSNSVNTTHSPSTVECSHDDPECSYVPAGNFGQKHGGITILRLSNEYIVFYLDYLLHMLTLADDLPVVIISINGRQRSGKSFMLNNFIKYLKFGQEFNNNNWINKRLENPLVWNDAVDPVTSGIQVWSEPIRIRTNTQEVAVILMDTQGLFDSEAQSQDNAIIFAFSVLLSSVFIFNDKYTGADSLQFVHKFLELARFAATPEAEITSNTDQMVFQKLVILLRDWQSQSTYKWGNYDDNTCPPGQTLNLKHKLLRTDDPSMQDETQRIRRGISSCFDQISVFANPHPGANKLPDQPNDTGDCWDEKFCRYVIEFVTQTLSPITLNSSVKRVFGVEMTGSKLIPFVKSWAELIVDFEGLLPSKILFENTSNIFYESRILETKDTYNTKMMNYLATRNTGVPRPHFEQEHERLILELLEAFSICGAYSGIELQSKFKLQLLSEIDASKVACKQINEQNLEAERQRQLTIVANQQAAAGAALAALAIKKAKDNLSQIQNELHEERGKHSQVISSRQSYGTLVTINRKKRNKFLGITVSPTNWQEVQWVYDDIAYRQAVQIVEEKIQRLEQRKYDALLQLEQALKLLNQ